MLIGIIMQLSMLPVKGTRIVHTTCIYRLLPGSNPGALLCCIFAYRNNMLISLGALLCCIFAYKNNMLLSHGTLLCYVFAYKDNIPVYPGALLCYIVAYKNNMLI